MGRYFFFAVVCALAPAGASAQVVITEVMYDLSEGSDGGREWIEVLNTGSAPVALAQWRLFENGTNHKITGEGTLAPGAYAVVADNTEKFKADWPQYTGLLFDSAFSLSNDGETVIMRDAKGVDIDSAVFASSLGGDGTGDSLQRSVGGGVFEAGVPTPGAPIPAGGLQKSLPKPTKSSAKKAAAAAPVAEEVAIVGERAEEESQVAAVAMATAVNPSRGSWAWWFAPILLASVGSVGVVTARHFKKDEWDIIEEIDEAR